MSKLMIQVFFFILIWVSSYSQRKDTSAKINKVNGDVLLGNSKKIIINKYKIIDNSDKSKLLSLNKYIDIKKAIIINYGGNKTTTSIQELIAHSVPIRIDNNNIFQFNVKNNQLLISCTVFSIDGEYVAKIENNKLLPSRDLAQYGSDRWIEVISKQDIPILQIELNKEKNSIEINGVFFTDSTYSILSKKGMLIWPGFGVAFMVMSDEERKSIFYKALKQAREDLTQLHMQ